MAINLSAPRATELKPRIVVFGVGGAGGNAVNNMIEAGLEGVEFVVANTDAQQLQFSHTDRRIQLGVKTTQGLGAGAKPEMGMSAAEESFAEIEEHLEGAHMVFITAGMGGGTGTGAAPIIARAARERGILTVGVVTKPFTFEGRNRMRLADQGVSDLQQHVDTLIVIPNQNLFRIANERTTFKEAFSMADQVLHSGVRSITDLMVLPGLINLDFADVRTVMTEMGKAMMGTGEGEGEGRALMAAQNAIQNPLLDEVSLKGARAVLVNVTGGLDMTLLEVDEAANAISSEVDPDANIIFGAAFDPNLDGKIRVSVVATGMDAGAQLASQPTARTATTAPQAAIHVSPSPFAPPPARPGFAAQPAAATPVQSLPIAPQPVYQPRAEEAWLDLEPVAAAPAHAPQPVVQPTIRIVDASVAGPEDELFLPHVTAAQREPSIEPPAYARPLAVETRRAPPSSPLPDPRVPEPKRGLMSLFGSRARDYAPPVDPRMNHTAPQNAPSARYSGGEATARVASPDPAADDLDIPSFLRRLAN